MGFILLLDNQDRARRSASPAHLAELIGVDVIEKLGRLVHIGSHNGRFVGRQADAK